MTNYEGSLIELLPCPFCGDKADFHDHPGRTSSGHKTCHVECDSCQTRSIDDGSGDTLAEAREAAAWSWNTRHHPTPDREGLPTFTAGFISGAKWAADPGDLDGADLEDIAAYWWDNMRTAQAVRSEIPVMEAATAGKQQDAYAGVDPGQPPPTQQPDDCRAAFEKWSKEQGWETEGYPDARQRWVVWQAAWAASTPERESVAVEKWWDKIEDIIAEFGDQPADCLAIIGERIGRARHFKAHGSSGDWHD